MIFLQVSVSVSCKVFKKLQKYALVWKNWKHVGYKSFLEARFRILLISLNCLDQIMLPGNYDKRFYLSLYFCVNFRVCKFAFLTGAFFFFFFFSKEVILRVLRCAVCREPNAGLYESLVVWKCHAKLVVGRRLLIQVLFSDLIQCFLSLLYRTDTTVNSQLSSFHPWEPGWFGVPSRQGPQ